MRNVIVTGGTRGLGLGIVRKLAAEGYLAIAVARKISAELAAEIEKEQSCRFIPFDLSETEKIPEFVRDLHREYGPIHGLVNNAASGSDGSLAMMSNGQIESMLRLNSLSPILLTKYVVRRMMADGGGRIVNVASIVAFTGYSGLSVYAATKSASIGFTRSLAREVGRLGINVNAVAPGFMDTEMTQDMAPERRDQIARRSALKRFPAIDDVADAVEFLLGDKSKSITGTVLTVDSGATA